MAYVHYLIWAAHAAPSNAPKQRLHRLLREPPLCEWDGTTAARLQRYLLGQSFQPSISAQQMQLLFLLARLDISQTLLIEQLEGSTPSPAEKVQLGQHMVQDSQHLCRLRPNSAPHLLRHAMALLVSDEPRRAARKLSEVLIAAQATKCEPGMCMCSSRRTELLASAAVLDWHGKPQLTCLLRSHLCAAHYTYCIVVEHMFVLLRLTSPQDAATAVEAHMMLREAFEMLALAEAWAAPEAVRSLHEHLDEFRALLQQPGPTPLARQAQLPVIELPVATTAEAEPSMPVPSSSAVPQHTLTISLSAAAQPPSPPPAVVLSVPESPPQPAVTAAVPLPAPSDGCCSNCGQAAAALRCGRCRTTVYCSRRCQVQHFRQGHHQECNAVVAARVRERLAASKGGGGGGANRSGSSS